MGHKKQARRTPRTVRIAKPSAQQTHAAEFRRSIKDCSTAELSYRFDASNDARDQVTDAIVEAQTKLTAARALYTRLTREHDVLTAEIEGRR